MRLCWEGNSLDPCLQGKQRKSAIAHTQLEHEVMAKTMPRQRLSPTTSYSGNGALRNSEDYRPLVTKQDSKDRVDETETESDIARRHHDIFNLVALVSRSLGGILLSLKSLFISLIRVIFIRQVPVVTTLLQNWDLEKLFTFSEYPATCYKGNSFFTNWAVRTS